MARERARGGRATCARRPLASGRGHGHTEHEEGDGMTARDLGTTERILGYKIKNAGIEPRRYK